MASDRPHSDPPGIVLGGECGCALHKYRRMPSAHPYVPKEGSRTKRPHREKSINDSSNELHEPFQRDLIALPSLVPDLYLAFPRFVPRPLRCDDVLSQKLRRTKEGGKGEIRRGGREGKKGTTYGNADLGGVASSQRGGLVRAAQQCPVSV